MRRIPIVDDPKQAHTGAVLSAGRGIMLVDGKNNHQMARFGWWRDKLTALDEPLFYGVRRPIGSIKTHKQFFWA